MDNFDSIEQYIKIALTNYAEKTQDLNLRTKEYTRGIKETLGNLGEKLEFKVCTSGFKDIYDSEWLYDLIWYINDDKNRLKKIPLVVECEWSVKFKAIKFDFEKLLVARAEHRLMIFNGCSKYIIDIIKRFKEEIKDSDLTLNGDRFLFAGWDSDSGDFIFELYIKN